MKKKQQPVRRIPLDKDPAFEPLAAKHTAPFDAHLCTTQGSIISVAVTEHDPEIRALEGTITKSPSTYPDLRTGVTRRFYPYGNWFVRKADNLPL